MGEWEEFESEFGESAKAGPSEQGISAVVGPSAVVGKSAPRFPLSDQGQRFAGVATIRAAIFDVIDGLRRAASDAPYPVFDAWVFSGDGSEGETENRSHFVDLVVKRVAELQSPPHDGIRIENLCDLHKRRVLPVPTAAVCGMCQAERGK